MHLTRRLLFIAVSVGAAVVAAVMFEPWSIFDEDPVPAAAERESGAAALETLVADFSADGSFVYGEASTAFVAVSGPDAAVVTTIANEASTLSMGDILWEVGFEPTVLFVGDEPSHRDLGIDDVGVDVLQLELNLVALGYDPDGTVTVDDTFTYNTSLMVERWQESIGAEVTGEVARGAVVYAPADRRVGLVEVGVGDAVVDGQPMLQLTGRTRELTFTVSSADRQTLAVGDQVAARLPDRTEVVASVTTLVITESGGVIATASVEAPPDLSADNLPVTVSWSDVLARDVLVVPESSLLRMDSGQYVVERASDGELLPVDTGHSSGGWVEVTGALAPGDLLIAP